MTKSPFPIAGVTRTAPLALMLAVSGLATAAYADDEYGTASRHEAVVRQAAESAPSKVFGVTAPVNRVAAPVNASDERFAVGENINFAAPGRDALIRQSARSGINANDRFKAGAR